MKSNVLVDKMDSKGMRSGGAVLRGTDGSDAEQLYCVVGLLITEGRVPLASSKGRMIGPHAHRVGGEEGRHSSHQCDGSDLCTQAARYRDQLSKFGRHGVPLCLEVLLLPDCPQHQLRTEVSEEGGGGTVDPGAQVEPGLNPTPTWQRFCVLEQWTLQLIPRRLVTGRIEPLTALLVTVTSYLHFSQLSAWLIESSGQKPRNIAYRFSMPRESALRSVGGPHAATGQDLYQSYNFPRIGAGESNLIELNLLALRRQPGAPEILCPLCVAPHDQPPPAGAVSSSGTSSGSSSDNSPRFFLESDEAGAGPLTAPEGDSESGSATVRPSGLRKKTISESGSLSRRTLPKFHLPLDTSRYKQTITSPMVVLTDQEVPVTDQGKPHATRCYLTQRNPEKDLTPFPRRESMEEVIAEFTQLNVDKWQSQPVGAPASAAGHTAATRRDSRKKKRREQRILFSDSSSNESLDRLPAGEAGARCCSPLTTARAPVAVPEGAPARVVGAARDTHSKAVGGDPEVAGTTNPSSGLSPSSVPIFSRSSPAAVRGAGVEQGDSICPPLTKTGGQHLTRVASAGDPRQMIRDKMAATAAAAATGAAAPVAFFNRRTGLPLQSSPVPMKRNSSGKFDYDESLGKLRSSRSVLCISHSEEESSEDLLVGNQICDSGAGSGVVVKGGRQLSASAPAAAPSASYLASQKLLVNFEESMLNGRIQPVGLVDGFTLELGASGGFYPAHVRLPLTAYFFHLSEDNAPSPYLGYVDLRQLPNKRGYHIPKRGSLQLTLFNPSGAVVKMFVVLYDLADMPANCQTFLRQRTLYMPIGGAGPVTSGNGNHPTSPGGCGWQGRCTSSRWTVGQSVSSPTDCGQSPRCCSSGWPRSPGAADQPDLPAYLRYLVHLRFHTTKSGQLYLHTDIRLIFSRDKFEFDPRVATYELRSFVEAPSNPRYSPKK